ncbi:hypothetical protein ACN28C_06025 [Plantactinospora sp. WMMC1484]
MTNHRPAWDAPTRSQLANGRAGDLTPAQEHRAQQHRAQQHRAWRGVRV